MLSRWIKRAALVLGALVLAVVAWDVATYDESAWLADYDRLKRDMAQGYANLDWMVERRGVDLAALDRKTTAELENAHSRLRAFLALRRFVRGFDDPHFRMKPGERPAPAPTAATAAVQASSMPAPEPVDAPAAADCSASGYEEGEHSGSHQRHHIGGAERRVGVERLHARNDDRRHWRVKRKRHSRRRRAEP